MVCTWLNNSVEPDVQNLISYLEDAYEIWEHMETSYKQQNVSKIFSIQQKIDNLHQDSLNLNGYYTKLNALWDELKHYKSIPTCNCGGCTCGGCKCRLDQQWLELFERRNVVRFFMRLNESYIAAWRQILMLDPLPSMTKAYNLVAQEEQQRLNISAAPEAVAFQVSSQFPRSGGGSSNPVDRPQNSEFIGTGSVSGCAISHTTKGTESFFSWFKFCCYSTTCSRTLLRT
ncbi:PREDICTED: uncharacterized protein LOC104825317 [Tarenaya hassleriana]|uniref:uncharacterized protein LOC104825317 n=1 Tax=Tarenaya hassleriana TaxID=28532 RepID=UPI00053C27FD|nr:PREDICTED: uncharacterized protein LOC104825317 [Tarenaya hassleriana]